MPTLTGRNMFLVATPQNIDLFLSMTPQEILTMFHEIDEKLQQSIPSIEFLAEHFGNIHSTVLYDYRSLLWKWIDLYFESNSSLNKELLFSDLHTCVMWTL